MDYTVAQVALMFEKRPTEIAAIVRKGGIKGIRIEETDDGVKYILTEQSVEQIGAVLKMVPKEIKANAKSVAIDREKFEKEIKRVGVKMTVMSKALGYNDSYISQAIGKGAINVEALEKLEHIFGFKADGVIAKEPEKKPQAIQPVAKAPAFGAAELRAAVYNGMADAFLEMIKSDLLKSTIIRALDSDEFQQRVNKAVYQALKGMKNLEERDSHPGLVPQRRPNA